MIRNGRGIKKICNLLIALTLCLSTIDYNAFASEENEQPATTDEILSTETTEEETLETTQVQSSSSHDSFDEITIDDKNIKVSFEMSLSEQKDINDLLSLGNHYVISDENILEIVDNKINPLTLGSATIFIYQDNELIKELDITVQDAEKVEVSEKIPTDQTEQIRRNETTDKASSSDIEATPIALFSVDLNNVKNQVNSSKAYASTTKSQNNFKIYLNDDESIDNSDSIVVYVLGENGEVVARGNGSYDVYDKCVNAYNVVNTKEILAGLYDIKVVYGDKNVVKSDYLEYTEKVIIDNVYISEEKNTMLLNVSFIGKISQDVLKDLKVNFIQDDNIVSVYDDLSQVVIDYNIFKLNIDLNKVDKNKTLNVEILSKSDASKYILACEEITSNPDNILAISELYDVKVIDVSKSLFELSFTNDFIGKEVNIDVCANNDYYNIIDSKTLTVDENGKTTFDLLVQNQNVSLEDLISIYKYTSLTFRTSDDWVYNGIQFLLDKYAYDNDEIEVLPETIIVDDKTINLVLLIPNELSLLGDAEDLVISNYLECQTVQLEKEKVAEGYKITAQIKFNEPIEDYNSISTFTISSRNNNIFVDFSLDTYSYLSLNGNNESFSTFCDYIFISISNAVDKLEILNNDNEVICSVDKGIKNSNIINVSNLFANKEYYTFRVSKYGKIITENKYQYIDDQFTGSFDVYLNNIKQNLLIFNFDEYSFFNGVGKIDYEWLDNYISQIQLININDESIKLGELINNISFDVVNHSIIVELNQNIPNVRYKLFDKNSTLLNEYFPKTDISLINNDNNRYYFSGVENQQIKCNIIKNNYVIKYDIPLVKENDYYVIDSEDISSLDSGNYDINFYADGIYIASASYIIKEQNDSLNYSFTLYNSYYQQDYPTNVLSNIQKMGLDNDGNQLYRITYFYQIYSNKYNYYRIHYNKNALGQMSFKGIKNNSMYSGSIITNDILNPNILYIELMDNNNNSVIIEKEILFDGAESDLQLLEVEEPYLAKIDNNNFIVRMISNVPNVNGKIKLYKNVYGNIQENVYNINYLERNSEGNYVYQALLSSDVLDYSNPTIADFYFEKKINYQDIETSNVISKVLFRSVLTEVVINNATYDKKININKDNHIITGYANPNENVYLKIGENEATVLSDNNGYFTLDLYLNDGNYDLNATSDSFSSVANYKVYVDTTSPVISNFLANEQDGYILITWNCSENATYKIYRDGILLKDNYQNNSYITSDTNEDRVEYSIVAIDQAGNKSEMQTIRVGDFDPPSIPSNVTVTNRSSHSISLAWDESTDNVGVEGYRIYRDGTLIAEVNQTGYTDKDLDVNKEYTYYIEAFDKAQNASRCEDFSASTIMISLVKELHFDPAYIIEANDVLELAVVPKDEGNLNGISYKYQYKLKEEVDYVDIPLKEETKAELALNSLKPGIYQIRGAVYDQDGEYAESVVEIEVKHDDIAPEITLTSLNNGEIYTKDVYVAGNATDNIGVDIIKIYISQDGREELMGSIDSLKTDYYELTIDSRKYNGEVTIIARAYDTYGNVGSTEKTIILDNLPPKPITGFTISGDSEYITLNWKYDEVVDDFDEFYIYRSDTKDGEFIKVAALGTIGYREGTADGIEANKIYYYKVTAVDKRNNESEASAVLSAKIEKDVTKPEVLSYLPKENSKITKQAFLTLSAYDNVALASISLQYASDGKNWREVETRTIDSTKHEIHEFVIDLSEEKYPIGDAFFKYVLTDKDGNTAEEIIKYDIYKYELPVEPTINILDDRLVIEYEGNKDTVDYYEISKKLPESTEESYVAKRKETGEVNVELESGYEYIVKVVDIFGVFATSSITYDKVLPDNEKPLAVINKQNISVLVNEEVDFDATLSTDNVGIVSYSWNFGDGNSAKDKQVKHAYDKPGTYEVTLTVKDAANNEASTTAKVEVKENFEDKYAKFSINILSRVDKSFVKDASVNIEDFEGNSVISYVASESTNVILEPGTYYVEVNANGYFSTKKIITVTLETENVDIYLGNADFISGEMNVTELTYDEMIDLGIDVNDPDNQHVYKYEISLEFTPELGLKFKIPVTMFINERGYIGTLSDGTIVDCIAFSKNGYSGKIYPISEKFFLVITGETKWLKQMFDVQLVVVNNSDYAFVDSVQASLDIPEGLSLATMVDGKKNNAVINMNNIGPLSSETAHWYIRGDKAGDYKLKSTLEAYVDGEKFTYQFETKDDIHVLDPATAVQMDIYAKDMTHYQEDYTVKIKFTNTSNIPLYGFSYAINTIDQYKVIEKNGEESINYYSHEDFTDTFDGILIEEFKSGDVVEIEITTKIMFQSMLEAIKKLPKFIELTGNKSAAMAADVAMKMIDVRYVLQKVVVNALEGSTVDLKPNIYIERVQLPSVINWLTKELYDIIIDGLIDEYDKDYPGYKEYVKAVENYVEGQITNLNKPSKDLEQIIANGGGYIELDPIIEAAWKDKLEKIENVLRVVTKNARSKITVTVIPNFSHGGGGNVFSANRSLLHEKVGKVEIIGLEGNLKNLGNNTYEITDYADIQIKGVESGTCYIQYASDDGITFIQKVTVITEEDSIENNQDVTPEVNEDATASVDKSQVNEILDKVSANEDKIQEANPDYPVSSVVNVKADEATKIDIPMTLLAGLNKHKLPVINITVKDGDIILDKAAIAELLETNPSGNNLTIELARNVLPFEGYENDESYSFDIKVDGKNTNLSDSAITLKTNFTYDSNTYDMTLINTANAQTLPYVFSDGKIALEVSGSISYAIRLDNKDDGSEKPIDPSKPTKPVVPQPIPGDNSGEIIYQGQTQKPGTKYPVIISKPNVKDDSEEVQDTWKEVEKQLEDNDKVVIKQDLTAIPSEILKLIIDNNKELVFELSDGSKIVINAEALKDIDLTNEEISIDDFEREIIEEDKQTEDQAKEEIVISKEDKQCNICGNCFAPFGICIWILLPIGIGVVTIIVFVLKQRNKK